MYDIAVDDAEVFAEVAAALAELHVTVPAGSGEGLDELSADPSPEDAHRRLHHSERERLGAAG
ncbi:hypothetical protein ACIBKZ_06350 [Streptomyces sp. NPDC050421]|uniref:hypothetical protein n=1 Tax=Streptomyces sp. NPDC050421 TaxID=3365613 RepID=UPI00379B30F8